MSALQYSAFDSEIFGLNFFRVVNFDLSAIRAELATVPSDKPVFVDAKLPARAQDQIDALLELGFRKAATMVELRCPVGETNPAPEYAEKLVLSEDDLASHAAQFTFQRFYQDPRISRDSVRKLMRMWIGNSLAGRRQTVAIGPNFCTYTVVQDRLVIDLLSCIDQGQGIAGKLLNVIKTIAATAGHSAVHITTEAENTRALHCYCRAGFLPHDSAIALHMLRNRLTKDVD